RRGRPLIGPRAARTTLLSVWMGFGRRFSPTGAPLLIPSPLVGELPIPSPLVGEGRGGGVEGSTLSVPPAPTLPHQGEGRKRGPCPPGGREQLRPCGPSVWGRVLLFPP